MKQIIKALKFQDIFNSTFYYFFNKKRKQHTALTIIISLGINILSISLFLTEISDLIKHKNPTVNYAKLRNTISPNLTLNTKELLFSIGVRDKNYNFINDPSLVTIKATYEIVKSINGKINQSIYTLEYMNCTNTRKIYEKEKIEKYFDSNNIQKYSCYNFTSPIIIGGKYSSSFYGNLAFYIIKCINGSENNITCKSNEEIENTLQNGWLQIAYMTSYVDYFNYTHPINYITKGPFSKLDTSINKLIYIYFSQIKLVTDNGLMFSSTSDIFSTEEDYFQNDFNLIKNDGIISTIYVCPSPSLETFYRKYIRIQEIAATIGGIFTALSFLFSILIRRLNDFYFDIIFSNSLFYFKTEDNNKSLIMFKKAFKFNIDNYYNNNFKSIDSFQSKSNLRNISQIQEFKSTLNSQSDKKITKNIIQNTNFDLYIIHLNISYLIKLCLDKITQRGIRIQKEYKIIKKGLMRYSDFINIGKNIIEGEKLKQFINVQFPKSKLLNNNKKLLHLNHFNYNYFYNMDSIIVRNDEKAILVI